LKFNVDGKFKIIRTFPYNLTDTVKGLSGVTNGILTVKDRTGKDVFVLYYLDSNAYSRISGIKGYDNIQFDQVQWYRENGAAFTKRNGGKPIPWLISSGSRMVNALPSPS
jgi:hypothetical protein